MKVMYSVEQKRVAVATYRRYKSYVRTLRLVVPGFLRTLVLARLCGFSVRFLYGVLEAGHV
uniref:hypothetical protein n=1 Tax=Bifidobacterium minimum TaxID=1693 RepID=UPI000525526D